MQGKPPSSQPDSPKMPVDEAVKAGQVLSGKFRVERVLGVGGMGVVVAATNLDLGQLVALKFMLRAALAYPDNISRFEREARAAVRLRSDHVAKVMDVGRLDDGAPYMVMEFLEGQDLDRVLRTAGPLPVPTAVDFVLQAAEAIAEAHALNIVHRDLKPKNLFVTQRLNGEPLIKVLDFGVSKLVGGEDLSLTATTQVLGSPSYMSPEQLRASRDVDQRTDIWALGAILYELLTGSVPFPAATLTQLTAMVISEPPRPIETLRADLPDTLRDVIMKCLEKKAVDRFQTVADFAAALAPFAPPSSVALATTRMSGGLGASSSSRLSAVGSGANTPTPTERPSIRAPGSSTDVAWDRTQLAGGEARRKKVIPIVIGVALASSIAGAFAVIKLRPHHDQIAPPPVATTSDIGPLPTVRDPITPPVVSGVERPPPTSLIPATATTTVVAPTLTTHVTQQKHDAGHLTTPGTPLQSRARRAPMTRQRRKCSSTRAASSWTRRSTPKRVRSSRAASASTRARGRSSTSRPATTRTARAQARGSRTPTRRPPRKTATPIGRRARTNAPRRFFRVCRS
jgi:serine/threonine protein kinase